MILSWNTTNKCNLKCSHCYRDSGKEIQGELSTEDAKVLINQIAKANFKIMIFSGGEPLMREDIFELINYAAKAGLKPVLGTNGTLISKEIAKNLKEAGISTIGISLDSLDSQKHNLFRGDSEAFKNTLYAMKNCRDLEIKFQVHTTVMNWNKTEVMDLTDFSVAMGAAAHHIFFLIPTGRGKNIEAEILNSKEYETLLTSIIKKQNEVNIEIKPTCAPQFVRIAQTLGIESRFKRGCIAGTSYCIINPIGNVQACAYLTESAGNIKEIPFDEIWKNSKLLNELRNKDYEGKCNNCNFKNTCGGCRARAAYYSGGDYMSSDKICTYRY